MIFDNQKEMFDYIWETRPHVSELSGRALLPKGKFQWHWQFLHVLNKGTYTKYKLESDNILLALPEEHENQERFPIFEEKRIELLKRYRTEFDGAKY